MAHGYTRELTVMTALDVAKLQTGLPTGVMDRTRKEERYLQTFRKLADRVEQSPFLFSRAAVALREWLSGSTRKDFSDRGSLSFILWIRRHIFFHVRTSFWTSPHVSCLLAMIQLRMRFLNRLLSWPRLVESEPADAAATGLESAMSMVSVGKAPTTAEKQSDRRKGRAAEKEKQQRVEFFETIIPSLSASHGFSRDVARAHTQKCLGYLIHSDPPDLIRFPASYYDSGYGIGSERRNQRVIAGLALRMRRTMRDDEDLPILRLPDVSAER